MKTVKIILEFSEGIRTEQIKLREYYLQEKAAKKIFAGHRLNITTCHPKYAELFLAKISPAKYASLKFMDNIKEKTR